MKVKELVDAAQIAHIKFDIENGRFRELEVLRGPSGRIADRVTVRAAMERAEWDRLTRAADIRRTSASEIIRVLVAEWLDKGDDKGPCTVCTKELID